MIAPSGSRSRRSSIQASGRWWPKATLRPGASITTSSQQLLDSLLHPIAQLRDGFLQLRVTLIHIPSLDELIHLRQSEVASQIHDTMSVLGERERAMDSSSHHPTLLMWREALDLLSLRWGKSGEKLWHPQVDLLVEKGLLFRRGTLAKALAIFRGELEIPQP